MTKQLTEEEYRAIKAVSASELKLLHESPKKLLQARTFGLKPSEHMEFGTLMHMALLETPKFRDLYVCEPDGMTVDGVFRRAGSNKDAGEINRNTTLWKQFMVEWKDKNASKRTVHPDDFSLLVKMIEAVSRNETIMGIIKDSDREVVGLWDCPRTGMKCKGRADVLGEHLADFKTTGKKSPQEFMRDAWYRLVHVQMGFYDLGFTLNKRKPKESWIFALPKDYEANELEAWAIRMDDNLVQRGREDALRLMETYKTCSEMNSWPGNGDKTWNWTVPGYAVGDGE